MQHRVVMMRHLNFAAIAILALSVPMEPGRCNQVGVRASNEKINKDSSRNPPPLAANAVDSTIRDIVAPHPEPQNRAEEARARRDLQAQEDMAKWAFWMLVAAIVGTSLTAVGVGLVFRTLHHTRRAADFAGETIAESQRASQAALVASEAATESNRIAGAAAKTQLRAYVGVQAVNYTYNVENGAFAASGEIINYGQTPALKFRTLASLNWLQFPIEQLPEIGVPREATHTLFPTMKTYVSTVLAMGAERIHALRTATGCFFFTIVIEYYDHAGEPHLETTRLYGTNSPNTDVWSNTHTATMTFYSGEGD